MQALAAQLSGLLERSMVVEFPEKPNAMTAAARAQWLAELAEALDAAQMMISVLGGRPFNPEAMELYVRIEAARLEVQALRLRARRLPSGEKEPKRTQQPPWELYGTDS